MKAKEKADRARELGRKEVHFRLTQISNALAQTAEHIDDISELVVEYGEGETMRIDQLACYASNTLQGTLALLRELRAMVPRPGKAGR